MSLEAKNLNASFSKDEEGSPAKTQKPQPGNKWFRSAFRTMLPGMVQSNHMLFPKYPEPIQIDPSLTDFTITPDKPQIVSEKVSEDNLSQGRLLNEQQTQDAINHFQADNSAKKIRKNDPNFNFPHSVIRTEEGRLYAVHETVLGEGTFGKVKVAQDIQTGDWVAIKRENVKKDRKHYQHLQQIDQEHAYQKVANQFLGKQLRSVSRSKTKVYSLMPIIPGTKFIYRLREYERAFKKADPETQKAICALSLNMALTAAQSLSHLHQNNISHGDLHLGNILVDEQGNSTIIDFGLSVKLDEATHSKHAKVNPYYENNIPELKGKKDKKHNFTTKEDLYALGYAFELLKIASRLEEHGEALGLSKGDVDLVVEKLSALKNRDPENRPEAHEIVTLMKNIQEQMNTPGMQAEQSPQKFKINKVPPKSNESQPRQSLIASEGHKKSTMIPSISTVSTQQNTQETGIEMERSSSDSKKRLR